MTTTDFIKKAYEALNSTTKYGKGTFGQKATKSFLAQKAKQYPDFYTASKINELAASNAYLYDCVGLIKGIIWGYPEKGKYKSGGLSDVSDQGLWDTYCINKSKDFSNIKPGAIVHIKGHVGICAGGGGIPVIRHEDGKLEGIAAVIDKDYASAKVAALVNADYLVIFDQTKID